MEARKTKELRLRVRRIKVNSSSATKATSSKTCTQKETEDESPCTSKFKALPSDLSPTNSGGDDFATVHFKLAAALEAAAAHATGSSSGTHLLDWQSMKSALIAEARPSSKKKSTLNKYIDDSDVDDAASTRAIDADSDLQTGGVYLKTRQDSDSSSTSSSDEDDDVPEILLVSPEQNADSVDTDRSMLLSKLPFSDPGVSVVDDKNPTAALSKILSLPPFDPHAPHLQVQLIIKSVVSLTQLSLREDNVIEVDIKKSRILEFATSKKDRTLSPFMDVSHIHVKHSNDEFFTFCSCKNCLKYREIVIHIMVEQFKTAHMVVMLLDVLIKAYGPMLKNRTAYNKFEKLLDANKEIYWIACGFVYNKKAEHMDFIYDESLSDNMIFVLFSSILMVNNPLLLLQILAFHVECIAKAYAEGFLEIVEPDNNKIPAEEMLTYILDGYDDLCRISEQISCYLFAFENDFLRKFSLTWTLLCQRLYQQHVYSNLTDTMLACIITLKEDDLTSRHATLIKKYIQFDDKMNYVEKRWTDVWIELNKFNLSDAEMKRRKCLLSVHRIFDTVVQDAIAFSLQEFDDDNDFYDFQCLENRVLAWQNIMAYTKMKWPDGFFEPPNILVCDDKCKKCHVMLEYHAENCKCITCSIAGGPLPPRRNPDHTCYKCLAQSLVEKEVTLYESKILNVCANGDFLSSLKSNGKRKSSTLEELGEEVCATLPPEMNIDAVDQGPYHVAWAVFHHFHNRKRYRHSVIEEKYFCKDCKSPGCLLARKIINNEVSHSLSVHLIQFYQPLSMSLEELRAILPNIMLYNRKMVAFNIGFDLTDVHDLVVKIYWTFIISLYATYFMEFEEQSPLNLDYFEICNNDIKVCTDKLIGNKDDIKFIKFLDKIKSLSPFKSKVESDFAFTVDVHTEEIQRKLDDLLNIEENKRTLLDQNAPPLVTSVETVPIPDEPPKKNCKEKSKKCCFDHSDLGDHCKENHSSKKRIKKECNHARMNETRDRLRKKLSQLVNARKNMKAAVAEQQSGPTPLNVNTKQPPSLKSVAKAAAAASSKINTTTKLEDDDDSLMCLSTLCKRISHLHASTEQSNGAPSANSNKRSANVPSGTPVKKSANNSCSKDSAANSCSNKSNSNATNETSGDKESRDLSVLSVYLNSYSKEFLDNYSRDQSKVRKWINETLSYIEGSGSNNGKKQPQPTNPKKAAKKAKQKQRKEEEKRIAELQDFRGQFHDIYFKEFTDKYKLKSLKSSKKRDKKQIGELETNIKKLQRAKAKVETVILELIATVKQTNSEFKFSYLPTKEQQVEKLKELEDHTINIVSSTIETNVLTSSPQPTVIHGLSNAAAMTYNNLNATTLTHGNYTLPYTHANVPSFPYQIDFQSQNATTSGSYGMIRAPIPTPMCYAPPQHQALSPDVVAAMAANAACNSNTDPSKRIVTIRRVNLPNVPEPRVTVTAKGSSPDKDKLLYTFVNGQLVPTTGGIPPMTQLPLPQIPLSLPMQTHLGNIPSENLISVPPPPLSKTQMKKERRRLAKIAAEEAKSASNTEQIRHEQVAKHARETGIEIDANKISNKGEKSSNKKMSAKEKQTQNRLKATPENDFAEIQLSTKDKKKTIPPSSISASDLANVTKLTKTAQRRSTSTTTSCSAETIFSETPVNSKLSTRENSLCSLKQTTSNHAGAGKKHKHNENKNENQKHNQVLSARQQTLPKKSKQTQKKSQQAEATKINKSDKKLEILELCEVKENETDAQSVLVESTIESENKARKRLIKRQRFVDNGQFDNNPFKFLHMQDTDSDWESSSIQDGDLEVYPYTEAMPPKVAPAPIPIVKPKVTSTSNVPITSMKTTTKLEEKVTESVPKSQLRKEQQSKRNTDIIIEKKTEQFSRKTKTSTQAQIQVQAQHQRKDLPPKTKLKSENLLSSGGGRNNREGGEGRGICQQEIPLKGRRQMKLSKVDDMPYKSQRGQQMRSKRDCSVKGDSRNQGLCTSNSKRSGVAPIGGSRYDRSSKSNSTTNISHASCRSSNRHSIENSHNKNVEGKPMSKRAQKQAQRSKKFQKQQVHNLNDCSAGIPNNMGYFNANDIVIPPSPSKAVQPQHLPQQQFNNLAQQMQGLNIGNSISAQGSMPSYASVSNTYQKPMATNISIMDQLNRGVQVENLSLPPGITLTKVDPVKSEQLRQKSESIRKLSKPLQQQSGMAQTFHNPSATIIAPPVAATSNYFGTPYAGVAATATINQSGIIMVEANPASANSKKEMSKPSHIGDNTKSASASASTTNSKSSKSKKRRNKSKLECAGRSFTSSASQSNINATSATEQPKMITLRNPMFHGGAASAAATILQQQPGLMAGRQLGGLPIAAPMPVDQPAAIIKNENGMFTIRNPALHQAVTNGLTLGGYRQFGNVSYYTPQEAAAEAVRATQQSATATAKDNNKTVTDGSESTSSAFSYFSSSSPNNNATQMMVPQLASDVTGNSTHNTISISCTSISDHGHGGIPGGSRLTGDAAVIARPSPSQKCISAIGSEIKSAQQQKQKSKEHPWPSFGQELQTGLQLNTGVESLACGATSVPTYLNNAGNGNSNGNVGAGGGCLTAASLQEKYQQSSYYNGFDVFPTKSSTSQISAPGGHSSNAGSLFDPSDCHMHHHNCGDDSPPPTITGYNSYLDGISNTGVIRYDDASFLKNLIPGQNLNNEVSIHNINDSNFTRSSASPVAHRVEITPVYGSRPTSTNIYEHVTSASQAAMEEQQTNFIPNVVPTYGESLASFGTDGPIFAPSNLVNLNELDTGGAGTESDVESFKRFNYEFEHSSMENLQQQQHQQQQKQQQQQQVIIDLNELLIKKGPQSQRTSPYLDETAMDNFVQNIGSLHITAPPDEQCGNGQLNGNSNCGSSGGVSNGSSTGANSCTASTNGWW